MSVNNCLIINTGSASKKYSFYINELMEYNAHFEFENGQLVCNERIGASKNKFIVEKGDYARSVSIVIKSLVLNKLIPDESGLKIIGIRIVAPGNYFLETRKIDNNYIKEAENALSKVPLHLGPALEEIKNVKQIYGDSKVVVGVSDSSFHKTLREENRIYSIAKSDTEEFGIYRFGYHGISMKSIVSRVKDKLYKIPNRVVVCHLGGGASITAIENGKSINNSMGFTPLEGLTMATRVGDIDPGTVIYLARKKKMSYEELSSYFNNKCGLLGISNRSNDIRDLLACESKGDKDSSLALSVYVARVQENIAKMASNLGGIDLLVFAGTVGERSYIMRERICSNLQFMGIDLDKKINNTCVGEEMSLENVGSKVKIMTIKTDEMKEIVKEVYSYSNKTDL